MLRALKNVAAFYTPSSSSSSVPYLRLTYISATVTAIHHYRRLCHSLQRWGRYSARVPNKEAWFRKIYPNFVGMSSPTQAHKTSYGSTSENSPSCRAHESTLSRIQIRVSDGST